MRTDVTFYLGVFVATVTHVMAGVKVMFHYRVTAGEFVFVCCAKSLGGAVSRCVSQLAGGDVIWNLTFL